MTITPSTSNPVALVTGASGGIGEALARELAAKGYDLILVARRDDRLRALAAELGATHGIDVSTISSDLSVPGAGFELADRLRADDRRIDVLINNAGFGDFGEFHRSSREKTMQMVTLNIAALTELMHALLPDMVQRGSGRIMNVASIAAFMPGPLMAVYYATKAYVLHLSEAVHEELKGTGVTVTALCPGPTESGFQAGAAMEDSKLIKGRRILDVETVARLGVKGLHAGDAVVVTGWKNRWQARSPRFVPRSMVPRIVKRAQAASH